MASLLPSGYLTVSGNQLLDQYSAPARISAVTWRGGEGLSGLHTGTDGTAASYLTQAKLIVSYGFNAVFVPWCDAVYRSPPLLASLDKVVTACQAVGLKVIFSHYNNEGFTQGNGLWCDSGAGTDETDGSGNTGTVTYNTFAVDSQSLSRRYSGNDTVIGYDIHHAPGLGNASQTVAINWGGVKGDGTTVTAGGTNDVRSMYGNIGNAILFVSPNVLVFCSGVQNPNRTFTGTTYTAPGGDLTLAQTTPPLLPANRTVYAVQSYPAYISGVAPDTARWINTWGFLAQNNIAPVYVSMGANLDGTETNYSGSLVLSQAWANSIIPFVNGTDSNLSFGSSQRGISTAWEYWGSLPGAALDGVVQEDNVSPRTGQKAAYSQLQYDANANAPFVLYGTTNVNSMLLTGLTPGQSYDIEVQASNQYGSSDWSPLISVVAPSNSVGKGKAQIIISARGTATNLNYNASGTVQFSPFRSIGSGTVTQGSSDDGVGIAQFPMFSMGRSVAVQGNLKHIHPGLTAWSAKAYNVGDRISKGGYAYICRVAGTSTTGPTGNVAAYNDNGVIWQTLSPIDFTSLNSWAASTAAIPATLTVPCVGNVWNNGTINATAATEILTLTGHTTSSTNTITLMAQPGESIRDYVAKGNPLYTSQANGVTVLMPAATPGGINYVHVYDDNVIIDGLQFRDPYSASNCTHVFSETGKITLRNCVFDGYSQAGGAALVATGTGPLVMENCLVIDRSPSSNTQGSVQSDTNGSSVTNCTMISYNGSRTAITGSATSFRVSNCNFMGYPNPISGSGAIQYDHNITTSSSLSSGGGVNTGNNLLSRTASFSFVDFHSDYRLIATAPAIDVGADYGLLNDIAYRPRPHGLGVDLGAWEY